MSNDKTPFLHSGETLVTDTRTVAEIEADLKAAKQREAQTARDAQDEKRRKEREAELAFKHSVFTKIAAAINAIAPAGESATVETAKETNLWQPFFLRLNANDETTNVHIGIKERTHGYYTMQRTGIYSVQVGDYANTKTFPQLKDKSFSYAKIAAHFWDCVKRKRAVAKAYSTAEVNRKASAVLVEKWRETCPDSLLKYSVTASGSNPKKVSVDVHIKRDMTIEELDQLCAAIKGFVR